MRLPCSQSLMTGHHWVLSSDIVMDGYIRGLGPFSRPYCGLASERKDLDATRSEQEIDRKSKHPVLCSSVLP